MNGHRQTGPVGPVHANKRHRATTEGRLLLSFAKQLAGENIDEVHLSDDDKPLDQNTRAALLPTLTHRFRYCCAATIADDAEPTRLPISGVGANGT
jgi:hypothetical protein